MSVNAGRRCCYVVRAVTEVPKTLREARGRAHRLVDAALARADELDANALTEFLVGAPGSQLGADLAPWPQPTVSTLTDSTVSAAVARLRAAADARPGLAVATGFPALPYQPLEFSDTTGVVPEIAPLTFAAAPTVATGLVRVALETFSQLTRGRTDAQPHDLYRGDLERVLRERLNEFLSVEWRLWQLAGTPPPYPVRWWANRLLWSPAIAGHAFCLRCADLVSWRRVARNGRRLPVCRGCLQTRACRWPSHAIAPHHRGIWWLECRHPGCRRAFTGPASVAHCPEHRAARHRQARSRAAKRGGAMARGFQTGGAPPRPAS